MADEAQLAIHAGPPAFPEGPPSWPKPDDDIRAALEAAYADGSWGRYHGPHNERIRALLSNLCGVPYVWPCSSGTIAVELALRGLKIGQGDEVILAAYDFPGNFRAIEAVGAKPVLVDLAPKTWVLDIEQVAAAASQQTKAVIASHLHGSLADMPLLRRLADDRGWQIVEDACQSPGATIGGRPAGSWGDCGVLSFGGSKLLTAGRGGAVVTAREDVLQRIKIYCERGNDAYPLSELQAAVLAPQIMKLAGFNNQRLVAVEMLLMKLADLDQLQAMSWPATRAQNCNSPVFYKLPWLLNRNSDDCSAVDFEQQRSQFLAAIRAEGVALDEGFRGFVRRTNQRCRTFGNLSNARRAAANTVILHHPVLLEGTATISRVADAICKVSRELWTH